MSSSSDSESSIGKVASVLSLEEEDDKESSSWESLDEDEDAGQRLSQNAVVLGKVFTYLSVRELLKCRLVCKLWNTTALLQANLGSRTRVKLTGNNIEQFNQTLEKTRVPFCRQFTMSAVDLDQDNVLPVIKAFKNCLTTLALEGCSASTTKSVRRFFRAPNLKEVKITGPLPEFAISIRTGSLTLNKLDLSSLEPSGHVSTAVLEMLIRNSPNLQSISIRNSCTLWKDFVKVAANTDMRITELKLFNMITSLELEDFEFLRKRKVHTLAFHNCIVWGHFVMGLLELTANSMQTLTIVGSQHEIVTGSFSGIILPWMKRLTLPIDGVSQDDSLTLFQALPNLQEFSVQGLFRTAFSVSQQHLTSITVQQLELADEKGFIGRQDDLSSDFEQRRELYKVLRLFSDQPIKLSLDFVPLTSGCLRKIYQWFPDLQELVVSNNSRNCLDGWTGIPVRICRKLSACRSFGVVDTGIQRLPSVSTLSKLKKLSIGIRDDAPKAEFTLLYILYGISQLVSLEELCLTNFTVCDIGILALSRMGHLKACHINGSLEPWLEFKITTENAKIKTFLLPSKEDGYSLRNPLQMPVVLQNVFSCISHREIYSSRMVCKAWHACANSVLHSHCEPDLVDADRYLEDPNSKARKRSISYPSPHQTPKKTLTILQSRSFSGALATLRNTPSLTTLVIRGMNKSMLEHYQRENDICKKLSLRFSSCQERRRIMYWFYPDGTDDLIIPEETDNPVPTSITLIGSWGKKDTGLLEFLDPGTHINAVVLHGLLQEVYDLILPRVTTMRNLESLSILPFSSTNLSEVNRNHLQILSNSSFSLKHLVMQKLQVPPETVAELIRSHRFTLETLELQNHVNVSDRLSFTIPHLRLLQLDEPPGTTWTTLNINKSVETIHFERSGYAYNQIKSKAMPKLELENRDFEHNATNMLCDINLFLESVANRKPGAQKSMLQEGTDSALRFFNHFRFLTSLTLRSVHAHYGILQGIFRNFTQLEKLVFTNTTGVTDEILTGIPKYVLDRADLMNPLNFKKMHNELRDFSNPSIRNLKNLVHLGLDDQTTCTDLAVVFGIIGLKRLEYFSCKKWKITDVSIRAISDMTSIRHLITDGATGVSRYAKDYFKKTSSNRTCS